MRLASIALSLTSVLALSGCAEDLLFPGSSNDGDSGLPTPGPNLNPDETPEQKIVAKEATPIAELVARVAPDFVAVAHPEMELIDPLEKAETIKFDKFEHLRDPRGAAASSDDDERLKNGSSCHALYHGFMTIKLDSFWLGMSSVKDTIRYGVHEVNREDLVRTKLTDLPAWASLGYQETTKSYFSETGKRVTTVYLGTAGDKTLVAQTVSDDEDDGVDQKHCAKIFDTAAQSVDLACSSVYNSEYSATRNDWTTWERAAEGLYKQRTESTEVGSNNEEVSYVTSVEQTAADKAKFEQDFRNYYTAADGGLFWGSLFPPYAYASGELSYTFAPEADGGRVKDCVIPSVTIKTE